MDKSVASGGLLGDTATRDYSKKLALFSAFAQREIRQAISSLSLKQGMHVLDAGCGTGEALRWLSDEVGHEGLVVGFDLSTSHTHAARAVNGLEVLIVQADLHMTPLAPASIDLVWSVNTLNHLRDPVAGLHALTSLLRPGGRIALGQSSLLPDMYLAWDARLERLINEAVRQYYRDRYQVNERDLTSARSIVGLLRRAGLQNVVARTFMIERITPLSTADENYLLDAIFRETWQKRLRPYLTNDDYDELMRLCDPQHPGFALRRADFHFLQSFSLAVGEI